MAPCSIRHGVFSAWRRSCRKGGQIRRWCNHAKQKRTARSRAGDVHPCSFGFRLWTKARPGGDRRHDLHQRRHLHRRREAVLGRRGRRARWPHRRGRSKRGRTAVQGRNHACRRSGRPHGAPGISRFTRTCCRGRARGNAVPALRPADRRGDPRRGSGLRGPQRGRMDRRKWLGSFPVREQQPAQGTARSGGPRPGGDPVGRGRALGLGELACARAGGHHCEDAQSGKRKDRARLENRRAERHAARNGHRSRHG